MLTTRSLFFSSLVLFASEHSNGKPLDSDFFEGRYQGQGRGCGGVLTIRHQTISWHSQALDCELKNYSVAEEELQGYSHRILYVAQKKNKNCRVHAFELVHDEYFPNYVGGWYANAYLSKDEYERRAGKSSSYGCTLIKKSTLAIIPSPPNALALSNEWYFK